MALLTCREVALGYEGQTVLEDVSFSVEPGEYLCIVGENGSGKSTLIQGLLRLKAPLAGEILRGDGLTASGIGYLPQKSRIQRDFPAGVYEVVLSGRLGRLKNRLWYRREDREAALAEMERLGLSDLRDHSFQELSGGQQQRVLLARAMCAADRLLLLDEPAAGLDPVVTAQLYEQIAAANRELGLAVIMVTHDIPAAVRYADRILHLRHRQLFYGTAEEYRKSAVGRHFLEGEETA